MNNWGAMAMKLNPGAASAVAPGGVDIRGNAKAKLWLKVLYCAGWGGFLDNVNDMLSKIDNNDKFKDAFGYYIEA